MKGGKSVKKEKTNSLLKMYLIYLQIKTIFI